jgi:integrase
VGSLLFDQYQERLRRRGASPHTIRTFAQAAKKLDEWLGTEGLAAETASMTTLEDYFDSLPYSASTKGTHLRYIQAAYNYGVKRGSLRHNPALDVAVPPPDPTEPRIIPNGELRAIREGLSITRDWIWFHLLAYTGMRRSEIRALKWDDGDPAASVLRLEQQTVRVIGKGKKPRLVPVHPALAEVLVENRAAPGAFVVPSDGANGVAMDTIMGMSKRLHPVYTPHDYRRTVATSLRRNGVDSGVIDRIMGWAPSSIFRRYYDNVADDELHRAILRLYADDPI